MEELLKKLNYKGESEVLIQQAPEEIYHQLSSFFSLQVDCKNDIEKLSKVKFALIFVFSQEAVADISPQIDKRLDGDGTLWFCYPKKSSQRYQCDIDRDHGWNALGGYGFEPVRQVALNQDFSALRFRRVKYIKKITRSKEMALTQEAKVRTAARIERPKG